MNSALIFLINRLYNLIIILFFMGGSVYLIIEKNWSLWSVVVGFILIPFFIGEYKITTSTTKTEEEKCDI